MVLLVVLSDTRLDNNFNSSGDGGAIHNSANLNISNAILSNNRGVRDGGAIFNALGSSTTISETRITGNRTTSRNGGAFYNAGVLSFSSSSVLNNTSANKGGAIFNAGNLTINTSYLLSNTASEGGALFTQDADATLVNTTISENIASNIGGAIYMETNSGTASLNLNHVTIAQNTATITGGVYLKQTGGTANFNPSNSILANNGTFDLTTSGVLSINTASTVNLIKNTDFLNVSALPLGTDPMLNEFNGGIHSIQTGSPVIDVGSGSVSKDQLGNNRDAQPDLGAFEFNSSISPNCLTIIPPATVSIYWIGCTNSDWNTATNWSTGSVPTVNDVVYIPIAAQNQLVIDEVATCAKLLVQIGAKCIVNYNAGGKLLIKF